MDLRQEESLRPINGVRLAVETFGSEAEPTIILIAGASSSMDWWDEEFCELLATGDDSGPRRVVRYDLRDTGRSTTVAPGAPDYTGSDLVDDLTGLIESLGSAPAHLVGLSLGGGLAQQLALRRPELVATLTLMSTTPGGPGSDSDERLPPPTPDMAASFESEMPAPDWSDPDAVGDYFVEMETLFSGDIPVDESRIRGIAARIVRRSIDPDAASNHWMLEEGPRIRTDIEHITAPTLVMHGTADPLFPFPHGEAVSRRIPGARLVPISGMGHQNPPPPTWGLITDEILRHTAPR